MGSIVELHNAISEPNLGTVKIYELDDTGFNYPFVIDKAIAREGLTSYDTFTYKESPSRATDGRLNNLNESEGFYVSQCVANLKYFNIQKYCELCDFILINKEFVVEFWSETMGSIVRRQMYVSNQERGKLYNSGLMAVGKFDYSITFVGTVNDNDNIYTINYNANGGTGTITAESNVAYTTYNIPTSGFTYAGHTLNGFNTRADGKGRHFRLGQKTMIYYDCILYAEWITA